MQLLLLVAVCSTISVIIADERLINIEFMEETKVICVKREDATAEELNNVLSGSLSETRSEKYLAACLAENFGAVSFITLVR